MINGLGICCEIALIWMSSLVQVMAVRQQAITDVELMLTQICVTTWHH